MLSGVNSAFGIGCLVLLSGTHLWGSSGLAGRQCALRLAQGHPCRDVEFARPRPWMTTWWFRHRCLRVVRVFQELPLGDDFWGRFRILCFFGSTVDSVPVSVFGGFMFISHILFVVADLGS